MTSVLEFARANASEELFLFLLCGFYSGMRLGTIADLKIETLERAIPDPASPELFRISVGPGAKPPVQTKFGVSGSIPIPAQLLYQLREYASSVRRLRRQARAEPGLRGLLFLTKSGGAYSRRGGFRSSAINVEMSKLRRRAAACDGPRALLSFRFHQTRATFATELARIAIGICGSIGAIAVVKEALLHRHEATTLRYIRFVERQPIKAALADEFTRALLGISQMRPTH
jgi:integrase